MFLFWGGTSNSSIKSLLSWECSSEFVDLDGTSWNLLLKFSINGFLDASGVEGVEEMLGSWHNFARTHWINLHITNIMITIEMMRITTAINRSIEFNSRKCNIVQRYKHAIETVFIIFQYV